MTADQAHTKRTAEFGPWCDTHHDYPYRDNSLCENGHTEAEELAAGKAQLNAMRAAGELDETPTEWMQWR